MAISVYDYEDYRRFLDKWLRAKKARSVRALAGRIGCSASYVSMVRTGDRSLKVEHARQWGEGMLLDTHEIDYWEALVRSEQSPDDDKERAQRQIQAVKAWRKALATEVILRVRSQWYILALLEFARCEGFKLDPEWIAVQMRPQITVEEATEAVEVLTEAGILVERDGKVEVVHQSSSTGNSVPAGALSNAIMRGHRAWMAQVQDAVELPATERYFGGLTVALQSSRFEEITQILSRIVVEAGEACETHEPDRVFRIGVAVVPQTERLKPE